MTKLIMTEHEEFKVMTGRITDLVDTLVQESELFKFNTNSVINLSLGKKYDEAGRNATAIINILEEKIMFAKKLKATLLEFETMENLK